MNVALVHGLSRTKKDEFGFVDLEGSRDDVNGVGEVLSGSQSAGPLDGLADAIGSGEPAEIDSRWI